MTGWKNSWIKGFPAVEENLPVSLGIHVCANWMPSLSQLSQTEVGELVRGEAKSENQTHMQYSAVHLGVVSPE